jgi:hypothetical protein
MDSIPGGHQPPANQPATPAPRKLFLLDLAYLALLAALGIWYVHEGWLRRLIPDHGGLIPLAVPWWGALGGVTISLTGIFKHSRDWEAKYNLWHIARPLLGAVIGTVGYLIFAVIIEASGNTVHPASGMAKLAAALVAFIVGYREEVFRELLKKATDVLFAAASKGASADANQD